MSANGKRKQPSFLAQEDDDEEENNGGGEAKGGRGGGADSNVTDLNDEEEEFPIADLKSSKAMPLRPSHGSRAASERTSSFSEDNDFYADSVSSPGGSSTASGPTYVRPAGFEHHAQEILATTSTSSSTKGGKSAAAGNVLSRHALKEPASKGAKKKKSLLSVDFKEGGAKKIEGVAVSGSGGGRPKNRKGEKRSTSNCLLSSRMIVESYKYFSKAN